MTLTVPSQPRTVAELRNNAMQWPAARAFQVDGRVHFMDYVDSKQGRWNLRFGLTVNR